MILIWLPNIVDSTLPGKRGIGGLNLKSRSSRSVGAKDMPSYHLGPVHCISPILHQPLYVLPRSVVLSSPCHIAARGVSLGSLSGLLRRLRWGSFPSAPSPASTDPLPPRWCVFPPSSREGGSGEVGKYMSRVHKNCSFLIFFGFARSRILPPAYGMPPLVTSGVCRLSTMAATPPEFPNQFA